VNIRVLALLLAGLIIAGDQWTKHLVSQLKPELVVIPGFFTLNYVRNTGAAWGILQGQRLLLISVSLLAAGVLLFLLFYERRDKTLMLLALGLLLGGTCGNLIDRIWHGYVVDFLQFYVVIGKRAYYWPSFNIADAAISTGVGLLILATFLESRAAHRVEQQQVNDSE
jgi:signal peptidase II